MKKNKTIRMFLVMLFVFAICLGNLAEAQTQNQMNKTECDEYKNSDNKLNSIYQQIMDQYKDDKVFLNKLNQAQEAWLVYRDSYFDSIFPNSDKREYGSVYPMCKCIWMKKITDQRNADLQQWLDGVEEGEVCAGSIKQKTEDFEAVKFNDFNQKIAKAATAKETWVKMPTQVIAFMLPQFSDTRSRTIEMVSPENGSPDRLTVFVTDDGIADDSLRGEKHKLELKMNEDGVWKFVSAGKAWRCWEGRGHQDYSTVPCL